VQNNSVGAGKNSAPEGGTVGGKQNWQNRVRKKKLSFSDQREYEHIEEEIEALEQKSAELEKQMEEAATDYGRLAEISREKEETDARLDERLNRYIELQELVEELEKQN
ncbi:MAG: ABC transporter C-terminal domain-containing protein, partial [Lachnospiraceae bacterium]|nr:ABC transporter C-terminal domain-containing protein [Lachnospiraceae bacterium]